MSKPEQSLTLGARALPWHPTSETRNRRMQERSNLAVALQYATEGIAVFPCFEAGPRAKEPRTQHGHHDATTDITQIRTWWQLWPSALVGIPAGPASGVWVLDVDGTAGLASLRDLLAKLGLSNGRRPNPRCSPHALRRPASLLRIGRRGTPSQSRQ